MSDQFYTLTDPSGNAYQLPIVNSTEGAHAIDVTSLYRNHHVLTYDPSFMSTASCSSEITYIDGDQGILAYRGYPIAQLAEKCSFVEVAYLLLYGELPSAQKLDGFNNSIRYHTMINESVKTFFQGFHYDAHPMAMLTGVVGSLSAFYHGEMDIYDRGKQDAFAHRIIAKIPTIAACAYRHSVGEPFMYPRNDLRYSENLLYMLFAVPCEEYEVDPIAAKALDMLFILHADHEQNASTSTVRLAGSSGTNPYAAISAGIACLWGPAHGGANEAVIQMLKQIGDAKNIPAYIVKAKDKNDPFRLMGFGHRVYKNYDPRAMVIRDMCHQVLKTLGKENDPLFELALELEQIALNDDYFKEKKLYPNVDFYSGIIYQALGLEPSIFTVMFAIARSVGWVAHWREMVNEPAHKISRPRQLYCGKPTRQFVPIDQR